MHVLHHVHVHVCVPVHVVIISCTCTCMHVVLHHVSLYKLYYIMYIHVYTCMYSYYIMYVHVLVCISVHVLHVTCTCCTLHVVEHVVLQRVVVGE